MQTSVAFLAELLRCLVVQRAVRPDRVVEVAEAVDLDRDCIAVAEERALNL